MLEAVPEIAPETTMEETEGAVSDAATSISDINAISNIVVGEYVIFGSYERNNDLGNGPEPVEWMVLDYQDGRTILLARFELDAVLVPCETCR